VKPAVKDAVERPARTTVKAPSASAAKAQSKSAKGSASKTSKTSGASTTKRTPQTDTSKNQARPSNRKPGVHQRTAAKRETTRESRSAQSKLTSTGSPSARAAASASKGEEATRDQLYQRAAALGINGRSRMTKAELTSAIKDHGG